MSTADQGLQHDDGKEMMMTHHADKEYKEYEEAQYVYSAYAQRFPQILTIHQARTIVLHDTILHEASEFLRQPSSPSPPLDNIRVMVIV